MAQGSITQEGDFAVIRVPMQDLHSLRVALAPCPCNGTKSISTLNIRQRIEKGLARLQGAARGK